MVSAVMNKFMISAEEGAETIQYLATSDDVKGRTGKYFSKKKQKEVSRKCKSVNLQKELWGLSEKLSEITGGQNSMNDIDCR